MSLGRPASLALISDIHANLLAFEACLQHARQQGADQIALLGDFVGYGPAPEEVVNRVMDLAAEGALVVRGNHDDMAVHPPPKLTEQGELTARWTHDQLSASQRAFLADLPLVQVLDDALLVHASARSPTAWEYVSDGIRARRCLTSADGDWQRRQVFVGHVHHQTFYYGGDHVSMMAFRPIPGVSIPVPLSRAFVATVGSAGQPRDGDPRSMYATYDTARRKLTFHRVEYDHLAAAHQVRKKGLPEQLALRLESGR
jgi:diadenosine tetraphosphatase ApaH/serine/threonine PP2A family protein phosphatase